MLIACPCQARVSLEPGQAHLDLADLLVVWAEVMTPRRHAVRLRAITSAPDLASMPLPRT